MEMKAVTTERGLRTRVLVLLLIAYIFNFVDRQIVGVLAIPIKQELQLTDRELGLLGGLAFAMFYTTLALPIARLADRRGRARIIAFSVALWSAFTALCGAAQNFWQLFLARMGVGIGEAGGVAPSYALISDYFPPSSRGRALAFFSLGVPIGSSLGIFAGGWIAETIDWRMAFVVVGLAGLPAAWALWRFIPEPRRGVPHADVVEHDPSVGEVASTIARKPAFWLLSFASGSASILIYGLIFWLPAFFTRSFRMSLTDIALFYGSIVLVGGVLGLLLGGWLGDRLGPTRPSAYALIPTGCVLLAWPFYAAGLFAPSAAIAWVLFVIPQALGLMWLAPVLTGIQHLVPSTMRATVSAGFLFINNLIGIGLGVYLIGEISTRLAPTLGDDSLRYAILYCLGFYGIAALLAFLASRRMTIDGHASV